MAAGMKATSTRVLRARLRKADDGWRPPLPDPIVLEELERATRQPMGEEVDAEVGSDVDAVVVLAAPAATVSRTSPAIRAALARLQPPHLRLLGVCLLPTLARIADVAASGSVASLATLGSVCNRFASACHLVRLSASARRLIRLDSALAFCDHRDFRPADVELNGRVVGLEVAPDFLDLDAKDLRELMALRSPTAASTLAARVLRELLLTGRPSHGSLPEGTGGRAWSGDWFSDRMIFDPMILLPLLAHAGPISPHAQENLHALLCDSEGTTPIELLQSVGSCGGHLPSRVATTAAAAVQFVWVRLAAQGLMEAVRPLEAMLLLQPGLARARVERHRELVCRHFEALRTDPLYSGLLGLDFERLPIQLPQPASVVPLRLATPEGSIMGSWCFPSSTSDTSQLDTQISSTNRAQRMLRLRVVGVPARAPPPSQAKVAWSAAVAMAPRFEGGRCANESLVDEALDEVPAFMASIFSFASTDDLFDPSVHCDWSGIGPVAAQVNTAFINYMRSCGERRARVGARRDGAAGATRSKQTLTLRRALMACGDPASKRLASAPQRKAKLDGAEVSAPTCRLRPWSAAPAATRLGPAAAAALAPSAVIAAADRVPTPVCSGAWSTSASTGPAKRLTRSMSRLRSEANLVAGRATTECKQADAQCKELQERRQSTGIVKSAQPGNGWVVADGCAGATFGEKYSDKLLQQHSPHQRRDGLRQPRREKSVGTNLAPSPAKDILRPATQRCCLRPGSAELIRSLPWSAPGMDWRS
eukprot:TRINITY_DN30822_c0_g1_i1.p1 TRINITY_DN30822_c0_g1~~TRINITY_DN30822_c0_g1_i1.p1  ORF type:complete len:803 (+),score=128.25 TRINITY_DN30822_c0_g1_i1:120-2411(+)